nr:two pore calcium channel protein 1 [Quercus suber]
MVKCAIVTLQNVRRLSVICPPFCPFKSTYSPLAFPEVLLFLLLVLFPHLCNFLGTCWNHVTSPWASRWFCLFFVLYILLGVYFVTSLILAVVYDSFKGQLAKQVSVMDSTRRRILEKAFNLIDKNNHGFLDKEQCIRLFEELNKYRTLPEISREEFELIFDELDDSHDFKINLNEFSDLCNAIALKFQKEECESCFEYFPSVYNSPCSKKLKGFVRSPRFGYIISFILVLNLFAVIVETMLDIENNSAQKVWQEVEFVFGWIYVLEMALKIYSFGFENYWRDGQNRFDFMITWIIVIGETLTFVAPQGLTFLSNGEWIRYLLLIRMLRLIRLLMYVKRYRAFIATFITLIPSLMPYLGTIFCVLCIYCSLGVQIFGGIVNAGNASLDGTDLSDDDYLLFNFNDYPNGMVTLFNLLVMNNWHEWMQSYKELTGTAWSLTYFVSFYLITVLLLLNLIVAFVLEAFFAEMELESSGNFEEQNKEVQGRKDRRRSVGIKSQSQRICFILLVRKILKPFCPCFGVFSLYSVVVSKAKELFQVTRPGRNHAIALNSEQQTHSLFFMPLVLGSPFWRAA